MLKEQRLPHQLRIQSQQIDKVLYHRQMEAQVSGGVVTPKAIQYSLQTQLLSGIERLRGFKQEILTALGVSDVQFLHDRGQWRLQIDRIDLPPVALLDMLPLLADVAPGTAVFGVTEEGDPLLLDLSNKNLSHLLLVGEAGAGKTTLIRTLAVSSALLNKQSQLQLLVINADKSERNRVAELDPLSYLPHLLEPVVTDVNDGVDLLQFLVQEMNYRTEQNVQHPVIVLLIDRLVSFLEATDGAAFEAILQLTQKGAEAGIHVIMSTERPESDLLTAVFKSTVPTQIVGHIHDQQAGLRVTGNADVHPEYLYGAGDFVVVNDLGATHFQAAYIGDYDLHLTLDMLHRSRRRALVAQPVDVKPSVNEKSEPESEPEMIRFKFDGREHAWIKPQPEPDDDEIPFDAGFDWQTEQEDKGYEK